MGCFLVEKSESWRELLTALWAGPFGCPVYRRLPARRSGLEQSFFCLENENRVWYTQELSPVTGVGDASFF
jgi:hypothetical protein